MSTLDDEALGHLGHLNLVEFCRESARWSGARGAVVEEGGMVFFLTGSDVPVLCNGAFRLDGRVDGEHLVTRADAWFGERGRGYTIWAAERDDDLVGAAERAGLAPLLDYPEMVCDARLDDGPLPASDVELRWVTDEEGMADFAAVNGSAYAEYGLPGEAITDVLVEAQRFTAPHIRSVVAYVGGKPAAAAQTILSHGIAGVYWVGTVAESRGRGLGEAVTRAVTNAAFDLGAAANSLQASRMGEPIYRRMGYRTLYRYRGFVRFR